MQLEDLSFAYDKRKVLDGISATIPRGRFVTLVGPSGSGKTTVSDLIAGLLTPTSGRILADGVDLQQASRDGWRALIGYVPQEAMLFSDTIRGNLTLGDGAVSDSRVHEALVQAGAWDFVQQLSGGIEHRIGEAGTALSGGQKQRIAIARALVHNPELLVLDEPTAALDAVSEREVCATIERLRGTLTILAVSHQPALRSLADEVWNLTGGRLRISPRGSND